MDDAHNARHADRMLPPQRPPGRWFGAPTTPEQHISRPRLLDILARAETRPLVVVSAPAGTGKTSLVAEWTQTLPPTEGVAWVTFDADDEAFWPSLVACLERLGAKGGQVTFPDHAAPVGRQALLVLAGALAALPRRVTLVVDGYEMISPEVAADVDFILRHSGHRLRLVIVARADPMLPLYRFRLRDNVTEVRMADLAFTDDEADQLLTMCSVTLSRPSLEALNSRLGGWAVGLRFAARILASRADPDLAVAEVVGDRGNIGEYLMGEVLDVQPPELRELLLSTSIPDTLRPGLADRLAGQPTTRALDVLTRANAFIEAVPEHPGYFRYQPFFRDLLRAELAYESPELMRRLQREAAEWFADQGLIEESVSHYAAIESWTDAAAEVIDSLAVGQLLVHPATSPLAKSLQAIPARLQDSSVHLVRAALDLGADDADSFAEHLHLALQCSRSDSGHHQTAVHQTVAVLQAVASRGHQDTDVLQALALVGEAEASLQAKDSRDKLSGHPELIGLVLAAKGAARERQGWLAGAYEAFEAAASAASGAGAELLLFESLGHLAVLECFRGNLEEADSLATRAMRLADSAGITPGARSGAAAVAAAWVDVERNDLARAAKRVEGLVGVDAVTGDAVLMTLQGIVEARIRAAEGDASGALACLETASAEAPDPRSWLMDRLRIEKGRVRVLVGEAAVALLEVEGLEAAVEPDVAVVVARAHLLQGDDAAAAGSLVPALAKAAPTTTQIEGWLVEAARRLQSGSATRARSALANALRLATHPRARRPFRDAHIGVRQLLAGDRRLQAENTWLTRGSCSVVPAPMIGTASPVLPRDEEDDAALPMVVEKLTHKELEVLGLLAELLTTEEIASSMFVSVNTIRTHVRSILRKLGVSRRNAAVRRARELELLPT